MKAAVLYQVPDLVIDEVGIRPPKTGEVLVKMAAAGVCHSDLGRLQGKMEINPIRLF
jgi:S-(hydroxymethyl)glutathione dehydrogenase/alcohol dehydrogenase